MKRKHPSQASDRSGVILLVVLGALTFFSVLVATYLVFANDSRDASVALSRQSARAPDVNWMMNESLMTLVRGTDDPRNPFFGEDLLSDYYGHDGVDMRVRSLANPPNNPPPNNRGVRHPKFLGNGIVRFPISTDDGMTRETGVPTLDDVYAGRLITFTEGPLRDQTYRVLRSDFVAGLNYDDVFIDIRQSVFGNATPAENPAVYSLFYSNPAVTMGTGFAFRMNGSPRNSRGIGYDATADAVDQEVDRAMGIYAQPRDPNRAFDVMTNPAVGFDLPVALQPNHLGRNVDKSVLTGDFDEDYDAADFNNWWLSHRRADGSVIPSFHRPAVLNFILNQADWAAASPNDGLNVMASFARGTFRPFPIAPNQIGNPVAINDRFTGGSNEFALRTSLRVNNGGAVNASILNQLARALIDGTYDVDNDADGFADSIWIDLGLPVFTSREGKLLRPLVAPMIEDISGRLNLNAHSNSPLSLSPFNAGLNSAQAFWAGTVAPLADTNNDRFVLRGLGWGPAEIGIPLPITDAAGNNLTAAERTSLRNDLITWIQQRYRFGDQPLATLPTPEEPGRSARDRLDLLRFGGRPPIHQTNFGYGRSTDPFGRGGVAMGRSGDLVAAGSGTQVSATPLINEAVNNPYESDPSGELGGDRAALLADLEVILRTNDFDSELLPQALRERLQDLINFRPEYGRSFTTLSVSDDSPTSPTDVGATPFISFRDLIIRASVAGAAAGYSQAQWNELMPPELRLGRKLDVNRAIGNGVDDGNGMDDNGDGFVDEPAERGVDPLINGVIDEPSEVTRRFDGMDNDGDGLVDEGDELTRELKAFASFDSTVGTVWTPYDNQRPNYTFDEPPPASLQQIAVNGRQLLARHLYLLMMALARDLDTPADEAQFPSIVSGAAPPTFDPDLYKARRLAQWAVNVVDYRDPDSINTRFVYDPTPFDGGASAGWTPPADLGGGNQLPNGLYPTGGTPASDRFVVWGVEAPQLVFSESAAYHDVRLRDTNRDTNEQATKGGGPMDDNDSDQVRIPQGSLLLELYCPHPVIAGDQQTHPGTPQELYDAAANLQLDKLAPGGAPVWRVAISQRHDTASVDVGLDPALDPSMARTVTPDSYSFQPEFPDEIATMVPPPADTLSYDRFILFVDTPTPVNGNVANVLTDLDTYVGTVTDMTPQQVFYAPTVAGANTVRTLQPGQFLVLAPGLQTRFGSKVDAMAPGGLLPSEQRFQLGPLGLLQYDHAGTLLTPTLNTNSPAPFAPALPMLIAAPRPSVWSSPNPALPNNIVGLNVSEPLPNGTGGYYPEPLLQYDGGTANYPLFDAYVDLVDVANTARDAPLDTDPAFGFNRIPDETPTDPMVNEPVLGTLSNYCSAFLQRLADPTLPYHEDLNPYRTVDWMPIDLSVFSGEDRPGNIMTAANAATFSRRSRQRNGQVVPPPNPTTGAARPPVLANALFSYETNDNEPPVRLETTVTPEYFLFGDVNGAAVPIAEQHVQSSLSFLNTDTDPVAPATTINSGFVGFDPSIGMGGNPNVVGNDRNMPQVPFAIHPWLNRPFASHFELMMVPACSQGRLFEEFSFDPTMESTIYPRRNAVGIDQPGIFNSPFRFLLNFFHSNEDTASGTDPKGAEFVRLFDFVHTLPRFRGEVELIRPQRLVPTPPPPPPTAVDQEIFDAMTEFRELLAPPFNLKYDNQRQGRVNLNTLAEFPVWAGLMQGHLNPDELTNRAGGVNATQLSFNQFIENRRGYPQSAAMPSFVTGTSPYNYDPTNLDPRFPTEFVGAFRSATTTPKAIDVGVAADTDVMRRRPVNGTLLRGAGNLDVSDPPMGTPIVHSALVRAGYNAPAGPISAQLPDASAQRQHDRYRNPFMRYQTLMRMPNLASDNSQVYVIRLTLGFFEVDAATQNLKDEYNADIGQNQRYQATFVVDRSIPVGFDPGKDLNARDIVIFESYAQ